jgi:hypothetical protein
MWLASRWIGFCGTAFDLSTFLAPLLPRHSHLGMALIAIFGISRKLKIA